MTPALPAPRWPWAVAAALLIALALITPVNHDEDQYLAAANLVSRGLRPFGDFMYLQTPVQPWLLAPVAWLADGWSFIALRLVSAVAGLGTLALVYAAQRRAGVTPRHALIATALCGSCVPFLFGMSLARNDALPALLLAVALWAAARGRTLDWGVAGLALGCAASIKISYGLPLAFGGFWLLWQAVRTQSVAPMLAWGIGGVIALLPTALTWAAYAQAFEYGVFRYAAEGAKIWYDLNGIGDRLSLAAKLRDTGVALAIGPALVALIVLLFLRRDDGKKYRAFVITLLVAGVVAAILPTPTYRQYFLPVLPPLFVALGLAMPLGRWPLRIMAALGVAAVAVYAGLGVADAVRRGPAAWCVTSQAHWIGAQAAGPIVTFSPTYVVDSGVPLDPRFATGTHVWRSGDLRSDAELGAFKVTSRRTLARELDARPPGAILTGFEGASGVNRRIIPDEVLNDWARTNGYRAVPTPYGGMLWLKR
ncbi:ArnT family glycosyltransferase [Glacieibacterium frigidum]|uniref:ArnT family glycosyltransferase n=1 Tax=Glacieibacterium frigidum TaxID=2593303 RepID=UPI00163DC892|nr:glycosyltransferase family 87 protein [Glacieibacterium frigidum]